MAVTIRDVAKLAGTSVSAVSVALNSKRNSTIRVSQATRDRILEAAKQLGYTPHPIALSLATGRSKVVGLMLPYADGFADGNPFCTQIMTGVLKEVIRNSYNLMLYTASSGVPMDQAAMLVGSRVEGLVLVMPPHQSSVFVKCEKRDIPYISILRDPEEGAWTVNCDDYQGGRLAAQHLIKLGHRKVAHLAGTSDVNTSSPRQEGFRDAFREAGIEIPDKYIVPTGFDWKFGLAVMEKCLKEWGDDRPTAIFAANDLCAEGAMRAIKAAGLRIPEDISVIGYDDTWLSSMTQPPMTTVHMPIEPMGEMAAKMLIDRLEGKAPENMQPNFPVSLTVRESTGPAPQ